MGAWIIGHNIAGYSPESDDVYAFADYDDALNALVEEMRSYADSDDESAFELQASDPDAADDEAPAMLAQVEAIVTDEITPGHLSGDIGFIVEDNSGRYISFWLRMNQYSGITTGALREWQYGAWMCNNTELLQEITAELRRRNEPSHVFFGRE